MKTMVLYLTFFTICSFAQPTKVELEAALAKYKVQLKELKQRNINEYTLPGVSFFLFGMGNRSKFIYVNGKLKEALTGKIIYQWDVKNELIVPNKYSVLLQLVNGKSVRIYENEKGLYINDESKTTELASGDIKLPEFQNKKYSEILKVLHHEILINILDSKPLPNYFVYHKPWNRDAAIMAMVFKETGNLHLIKKWVMQLDNPFDYNNKGISEADNPGEVLYLLSLFTDKNNPLVISTLDSAQKFIKGNHIEGKTDFGDRFVFQTKWMKYGLKSIGLPDNYEIPLQKEDNYSALFWWDYKDKHIYKGRFNIIDSKDYPYLTWAEDHFYNETNGYVSNQIYPLSWEKNACCANYMPMQLIDPVYSELRLSVPHTWHASEMFLLLNTF
ncbi:MAG: hypothetical protein SFY32_05200 [Bacteroidota bacterium]|nr:hypothetical protein [Bacteroidota bacterium]